MNRMFRIKSESFLWFNQNSESCLSCQSLLIDFSGFAVSLLDQSKWALKISGD
jgi:hypothetical protein